MAAFFPLSHTEHTYLWIIPEVIMPGGFKADELRLGYTIKQLSNYLCCEPCSKSNGKVQKTIVNDDRYLKVRSVVLSLLDQVILNNNTTIKGF